MAELLRGHGVEEDIVADDSHSDADHESDDDEHGDEALDEVAVELVDAQASAYLHGLLVRARRVHGFQKENQQHPVFDDG